MISGGYLACSDISDDEQPVAWCETKMRSIVLLILAAMALLNVAGACCGGGGPDGALSPTTRSFIGAVEDSFQGTKMTYGGAAAACPLEKASIADVGGEDGREPEVPLQDESTAYSENLEFGKVVIAHLNEVQVDFNLYRELWEANRRAAW